MMTLSSTPLASAYHQVRIGGDAALFKGMMKALIEADATDIAAGGPGMLDRAFIAEHTVGIEDLKADIAATDWPAIERKSGLTRAAIEGAARAQGLKSFTSPESSTRAKAEWQHETDQAEAERDVGEREPGDPHVACMWRSCRSHFLFHATSQAAT